MNNYSVLVVGVAFVLIHDDDEQDDDDDDHYCFGWVEHYSFASMILSNSFFFERKNIIIKIIKKLRVKIYKIIYIFFFCVYIKLKSFKQFQLDLVVFDCI